MAGRMRDGWGWVLAEGDGAAVEVKLVHVDAEFLDARQRLRGKGLQHRATAHDGVYTTVAAAPVGTVPRTQRSRRQQTCGAKNVAEVQFNVQPRCGLRAAR